MSAEKSLYNRWGYRNIPHSQDNWKNSVTQKIANYKQYWADVYSETPWTELTREDKRAIIKIRFPRPLLCPVCGVKKSPRLYNLSGECLDNNVDWYYSCQACYDNRFVRKARPGSSATWFKQKEWNTLSRRSKVRIVRDEFPMPSNCICGAARVQLVSISGTWLFDTNDYEWLCRSCSTKHNKSIIKDAQGQPTTPQFS